MPESAIQTQMPIRELPGFAVLLREAIARLPNPNQTRAAVESALSTGCVQCAMPLSGADVLNLPDSDDPRLARIRDGYCARNGCDCHFYNVNRAPHPDLDWARLLSETNATAEQLAESAAAEVLWRRRELRKKKALRVGIAVAALFAVYVARQIYMGGTIPFIREPEKFEVDRQTEAEPFQVDRGQ